MRGFMEVLREKSSLDIEQVTNWLSTRQIRIMIGRLQGRKGMLPEATWYRWKKLLYLTNTRLYSPDQVRLVVQFAGWLNDGGTVEGFQKSFNVQPSAETYSQTRTYSNDSNQRQTSTQDDSLNWFS